VKNLPNILFFCSADRYSGAEIVLERIIFGLIQKRVCNAFILGTNEKFLENVRGFEKNVYALNNIKSLKGRKGRRSIIKFLIQIKSSSKQLKKFLNKNKIDIIHANSIDSAIYALFQSNSKSIPLIWHHHNVLKRNSSDYFLAYLLSKKVKKIIAVSGAALKSLPKKGQDKAEIIYNGVDVRNKFNPYSINVDLIEDEYSNDNNDLMLGYVGQIHPSKGIDIILDVLSELKKMSLNKRIFLNIAGKNDFGNEYYQFLLKKIKLLNIFEETKFLGHVDQIEFFYKKIDILILPSVEPEAFPTVLLEASAMEKIVFSSNLGGGSEIIEEEINGFLFEPKNKDQLKEKILKIIKNIDLGKKIRANARKNIIQKFDSEKQVECIYKIYDDVLRNGL